jgi:dTDP-glucose 4,6-dehydratase
MFMRILVTGAAGFTGSEYVRAVLSGGLPGPDDVQVTVLDSLAYSGNPLNLAPVADHRGYRFVHGDICDPALVNETVPGHDAIVHFAAESHIRRSIGNAAPFVTTNVLGTRVLLDAAQRHQVGRFVHVSTDEVCGPISQGAWTEQSPLMPDSPYAASKAASDLLVLAYHRAPGPDVVVTRCSNNYGRYQFPDKVIPLFVTNLLYGRPVPLYGDGGNVRDWLHVSDHGLGVQFALVSGRPGEVHHIGGGTELTNKELTGRLLAACGAGWDMVRCVTDRKGHDRAGAAVVNVGGVDNAAAAALNPPQCRRSAGSWPRGTDRYRHRAAGLLACARQAKTTSRRSSTGGRPCLRPDPE